MEDFVPFEIAKKLKEKGFPQRTFGEYDMQGACYIEDGRFFENGCITEVARAYTAPTISQVLKWLREKKKYHIEFVGNACGYLFIISDIPSEGGTDRYCSGYSGPNDGGTWDKYEDCAIASIEYVLDNLI